MVPILAALLLSASLPAFAQADLNEIFLCDDGHGLTTYQNTGASKGCRKVRLPPDPDNWVAIAEFKEMGLYVDRGSFVITPQQRKAWVMTNYESKQASYGGEYYSLKELQVFRCQTRQVAVKQQLAYSGSNGGGTVVRSAMVEEGKERFFEPAPESVGDATLKGVCKLKLTK